MPVELNLFVHSKFRFCEESFLPPCWAVLNGFEDGLSRDSLVNMKGDSVNVEGSMLSLSSPSKLWVEMGIVAVGDFLDFLKVVCRESRGRIVLPLLLEPIIFHVYLARSLFRLYRALSGTPRSRVGHHSRLNKSRFNDNQDRSPQQALIHE